MKSTYTRALLTIHLFYFVLLFLTYDVLFMSMSGHDLTAPKEFVQILSWVPLQNFTTFTKGLGLICFISFSICSVYPWIRSLRLTSFISILFLIALQSSYGKVNHGYYGFLFASLALIFLPRIERVYDELFVNEKQKYWTLQILFIAQFSSILCYALAGLWKLRYVPETFTKGGWEALSEGLGNTIAYEHLTYSHKISAISQFFLDHDNLTGILFFSLVALQVLSVVVVFLIEAHWLFGIFIVLFHILSEIILKIPFKSQMYLMVIFFIFSPFSKLKFWQKKSLQ